MIEGTAGDRSDEASAQAGSGAPIVVAPRRPGPIIRPRPPGPHTPDELDQVIEEVFGLTTDERPGRLDLLLVVGGIGDPIVPAAVWLYVLAALVAVEAIEIARLLARIGAYGWRLGALTYHASQWARNFTFGMFYAFTLALSRQPGFSTEPPWLRAIQGPILIVGPYVVLAFLLSEIALCLQAGLEPSRPDEQPDSRSSPVR